MTSTSRRVTTVTSALSAAALSTLLVAAPAHAAPAVPGADVPGVMCDATTCRYVLDAEDAGVRTFVVPDGVTRLAVELAGAGGNYRGGFHGGDGGALRTEIAVTPGETLTAHVPGWGTDGQLKQRLWPSEWEPEWVPHNGGDLAALYRGTGASATPIAAAGGGGEAGPGGDGGAGGGWDPDPARLLTGHDGQGPGAGLGATPTAGGGVRAAGAVVGGRGGGGPAAGPGSRGVGGSTSPLPVREGRYLRFHLTPDGGHGWYGGGSASHHDRSGAPGGGGGGSGYLADGLVATQPSQSTLDAAQGYGGVALEWSVRPTVVLDPVVLGADGEALDGPLTSRDVTVTAASLPAGAELAVSSNHPGYPGWARVGADGTARIAYTLPAVELDGEVWLNLTVSVDGEVVGTARVDLEVPALATATELTVPQEVAAGAALTVQLERTGTQFGEPTRGLAPRDLAAALRTGTATLLLDGEELGADALTIADDLAATGPLSVSLTAPADGGAHTLELRAQDGALRLADVSRTFTVTAAPAATPAPGTGATPTAAAGASSATGATGATGAPQATERSEVLAASGGSGSTGVLATTGAQVTLLGLLAVVLIVGGVVLARWRARSRA